MVAQNCVESREKGMGVGVLVRSGVLFIYFIVEVY